MGDPNNDRGTNNGIVFTKIEYVDKNTWNSNNRTADVEFYIAPLADIRKGGVGKTNNTAFINFPYIDESQIDLENDSIPATFYGISVLKFKGRVQQLNLISDVFPENAAQRNANNLIHTGSNGILMTSFNANRFVYLTADPNNTQRFREKMTQSPKNQ